MSSFGVDPDSVLARTRLAHGLGPGPSRSFCILYGSLGFGLVSLGVYATVAFGGTWLYQRLGEIGAFAFWALLFMVLAGLVLSRLAIGPGSAIRLFGLFVAGFFVYAGVWVGAYVSLRGFSGELLGAILGPSVLGMTLAHAFDARRLGAGICFLLFAAHATGYFGGELLHRYLPAPWGMLVWGAAYGLGFGAGLGWALYLCQEPLRARLPPPGGVPGTL
jgi:hypothetical protein